MVARPGVDAPASSHPFISQPGRVPPVLSSEARPGSVDSRAGLSPAGGSRLLAARLLERNIVHLARAAATHERRLAPNLQRLRSRRLYRFLGYVRLGDYLTERLGMSLRRCQSILRLQRVVESVPPLAAALEAGEVSLSKVETLAGVATATTAAFWLDRARRLSVADLRELTRAARTGAGPSSGAPATAAEATTAEAVAFAGGSAAGAEEPIEQDEPGRLLSFPAPAPVCAVWHWTLDLIRRVAGHQEPAWRCGVPDVATQDARAATSRGRIGQAAGVAAGTAASDDGVAAVSNAARSGNVSGAESARPGAAGRDGSKPVFGRTDIDRMEVAAWSEACDAVREALASFGAATDVEAIRAATTVCDEDDELDAWDLDARLRRLVRLRQSLAWRQGRLLATLASMRLHRELGFGCLDDWIDERLPMSPRRARYLMALERRLRGLPLLTDAYRRGLISWCHALLLVRVVAQGTQSRWIRYARRVTVRRLEDAIVGCEVEAANPAHVGAPLPPPADHSPGQITRAAGRPASLHTSAPAQTVDASGIGSLRSSSPLAGGGVQVGSAGRLSWRRIVFWAPLDVAALWDSALRACRTAAGPRLDDWECFLHFVQALRDTWENPDDPRWKRRYRIFERDGWRCMAPGCTSRSGLNEHHIVFRSQQGSDDEENLVTLCVGHHEELHAGHLRCLGRAPDSLWWDLGVRRGGEPLVRYFGERVVGRRPFVFLVAPESGAA